MRGARATTIPGCDTRARRVIPSRLEVGPLLLTVIAAGLLGGGLLTDITVMVVIAAVALIVICAYNGLRGLIYVCDETSSPKITGDR